MSTVQQVDQPLLHQLPVLHLETQDLPVTVVRAGPRVLELESTARLRPSGMLKVGFVFGPEQATHAIVVGTVVSSARTRTGTRIGLDLIGVYTTAARQQLCLFLYSVLGCDELDPKRFLRRGDQELYVIQRPRRQPSSPSTPALVRRGASLHKRERSETRVPVRVPASIQLQAVTYKGQCLGGSAPGLTGVVYNISPSGVSVLTDGCIPEMGDQCTVMYTSPDMPNGSLVLKGSVVWVLPGNEPRSAGFGVYLDKMHPRNLEQWAAYVEREGSAHELNQTDDEEYAF